MNNNHLKLLTAGILSTTLLGVSTPAIALESPEPTTTQQTNSWGLDRIDQRNLPLDGNFTAESEPGKGVNIYILDDGFNRSHDEFTGRVAEGFNAFNFAGDTSACDYHGTHVAGIAAGTNYGVAKSATIIPVKVSDNECEPNVEALINGLRWVKEDHQEGTPAVVNLSVVANGSNESIDNAVKALIDEGITVVAGAGNKGIDACTVSPARIPEVITVAASNRNDKPWDEGDPKYNDTSNFGRCVDIYAPGQDILSPVNYANTGAHAFSGTSMASPYVAGVAAVILSRNPALTPAQVATEIRNTSTSGILTNLPSGTQNRLLFLSPTTSLDPGPDAMAPSPPPYILVRTGTAPGVADVEWDTPDDNGSMITRQTIHIYEGTVEVKSVDVLDSDNFLASANSTTLSGLGEGKTYTFAMTATNAIGTSLESVRTPPIKIPSAFATAPSAPTNVVGSPYTTGMVDLQWVDGGSTINSHTIHAYENGIEYTSYELNGDFNGARFSLPQGRTFTFTVTATNDSGTSPESTPSNPVTIPSEITAPEAPTAIRAAPVTTGGSANVYWEAASDGGSAITSYEVTVYNGTNVVKTVKASASSRALYITGLYNGTNYHFTIKAVNSVGTSPESNATNSINPLAKAPSTATSVRAYARDNAADIYWTRGNENGSPLTSQIITIYSGTTKIREATLSSTTSSVRVTGATEGREYQYTITEVNSIGSSAESAKTNIVTPY